MFGVMGAMILGGAVTMQVFARSEAKPATDLMLANIEAMADDEVDVGYVSSVSEHTTQGDTFPSGGKTCQKTTIEKICRGNGTIWCESYFKESHNCW